MSCDQAKAVPGDRPKSALELGNKDNDLVRSSFRISPSCLGVITAESGIPNSGLDQHSHSPGHTASKLLSPENRQRGSEQDSNCMSSLTLHIRSRSAPPNVPNGAGDPSPVSAPSVLAANAVDDSVLISKGKQTPVSNFTFSAESTTRDPTVTSLQPWQQISPSTFSFEFSAPINSTSSLKQKPSRFSRYKPLLTPSTTSPVQQPSSVSGLTAKLGSMTLPEYRASSFNFGGGSVPPMPKLFGLGGKSTSPGLIDSPQQKTPVFEFGGRGILPRPDGRSQQMSSPMLESGSTPLFSRPIASSEPNTSPSSSFRGYSVSSRPTTPGQETSTPLASLRDQTPPTATPILPQEILQVSVSPSASELVSPLQDAVVSTPKSVSLGSGASPAGGISTPSTHLSLRTAYLSTPRTPSPKPRRSPRQSPAIAPPHDVSEEALPQVDATLQHALGDTGKAVAALAKVLSGTSHPPGSVMQKLEREAQFLESFECPEKRIVALVGKSGVGKSSLVNSLLDEEELADESNNGWACTCFATEYHHHKDENFALEIDFFSLREIRSQVSDLLRGYRDFHYNRAAALIKGDEVRDAEEKARLAKDFFNAMFSQYDWPGLLENKNLEEEAMIRILMSQVPDETLRRSKAGQLTETARNAGDFRKRLHELSSNSGANGGSPLWPYIRKVKISLNAHILSRGLILVDLPGLRDLNLARCKITERYLLECDEIFAVSEIGRAATDASVADVFDLWKKAKLSNIGIVCTKVDDATFKDELHTAQRNGDRNAVDKITTLIRERDEVKDRVQELQLEIDDYEAEEYDELDRYDQQRLEELRREKRSAKRIRDEKEFELRQYAIRARNARVSASLRSRYADYLPGQELRVFCVSNTEYWDKRTLSRDVAMRHLQLSGIIDLRGYCMSIVARAQRRAIESHIKNSVPGLITSVDLWVKSVETDAGTQQRAQQVLKDVEQRLVKGSFGSDASPSALIRDMGAEFQSFRNKLANLKLRGPEKWAEAAVGVAGRGFHHATYAAFCRHWGIYGTPASNGFHNWNEEAGQAALRDLGSMMKVLHAANAAYQEKMLRNVKECLGACCRLLENAALAANSRKQAESFKSLAETLLQRGCQFNNDLLDLWQDFSDNCRRLEATALSGNRSAMLGELMEPSYIKAQNEYGTGSHARRRAIIDRGYGDPETYRTICRQLEARFKEYVEEIEDSVKALLEQFVGKVKESWDFVRTNSTAVEVKEDQGFRRVVSKAVAEARERMKTITAEVDGCVGNQD